MVMRIARALVYGGSAITMLTSMTVCLMEAHAMPAPQDALSAGVPTIPANDATCTTSFQSEGHEGAELFYEVHVGPAYIEGRGCLTIKALLSENATVAELKCVDVGVGQTNLTFVTPTEQEIYQIGICNMSNASFLLRRDVDPQASGGINAVPLLETSLDDKENAIIRSFAIMSIDKGSTLHRGTSWCVRRSRWFSNKAISEVHIGTAYYGGVDFDNIEAHISEKMATDDVRFYPKGFEASNTKVIIKTSDLDEANLSLVNVALDNAYPGILFTCDPDEAHETVFKRSSISSRGALAENTSKCGKKWQDYFSNSEQTKLLVKVGRPYLGGINCASVADLIRTKFALDGLWCEGSQGDKNTKLWVFASVNTKDLGGINEGLQAAYPMVDEFECPTS